MVRKAGVASPTSSHCAARNHTTGARLLGACPTSSVGTNARGARLDDAGIAASPPHPLLPCCAAHLDVGNVPQQDCAHEDERGASCVRRDGCQDGREEERDKKEKGDNDGCARGETAGLTAACTSASARAFASPPAPEGAPASPVRPPSSMPAADSMNTVSGVVPIMLPLMMPRPSDRKAHIWPGNSWFSSKKPASRSTHAAGHSQAGRATAHVSKCPTQHAPLGQQPAGARLACWRPAGAPWRRACPCSRGGQCRGT